MENIWRICLVAIAGCMLGGILKQWKPEYVILTALATLAVLLSMGQALFQDALQAIQKLYDYMGDYERFLGILLRIMGVSWLCQLSADLCQEAGYGSIGSQLELLGKLYIVLSGLPIAFELLQLVRTFS